MSCDRFERALALDVSGDLNEREARALRTHLAGCAQCREVAARLERNQAALRALGDQELPEGALRSVRARVRAAIASEPEPRSPLVPVWAWAAGASVVALVAGLIAWGVTTGPSGQRQPSSAPRIAGSEHPEGVGLRGAQDPVGAELVSARSAKRRNGPDLSSSPVGAELASARSREDRSGVETLEAALQRSEPLSPEDADQLARALVYVSQLDGVPPPPNEPDEAEDAAKPPTTVVRLATQDPNVVIYWQMDSNGG
jgi:hypothetical protein